MITRSEVEILAGSGASCATFKIEDVKALLDARDAASSILWMAEEYAQGGGWDGHEMRDYREAAAAIASTYGKALTQTEEK